MKKTIKNVMTFCALLYGLSLNGQNQIWPVGNQQWSGVFGSPQALPTPSGPSGLDYAGQQAQYAANAWHNPQTGALMFFVVDGVVYDCEGYYLGAFNDGDDPVNYASQMRGMAEISIVPDPGDCKRYYVIGTKHKPNMLNSNPPLNEPASNELILPGEMCYGIVNLSLPRLEYNTNRQGALELIQDPVNGNAFIKSLHAMIPTNQKFVPSPGSFVSADFLAVSPKNAQGEHFLYYQDHSNVLYAFRINSAGISYINMSAIDTRTGTFPNLFVGYPILDNTTRGEMEIITLPNGTMRVVGISYNVVYEPSNGGPVAKAAPKLYRQDFGINGIPIANSFIEHQHYANPNNSSNGLALLKGIEVSPNKEYVYFTATPNTSLPRSLYCLNMNDFSVITMNGVTDQASLAFSNSMIERANNGTTDGGLYLASANGLHIINTPNNPQTTTTTHVLPISITMSRLNAQANIHNDTRIGLYLLPDQMDFDPNCQVGCYSFACGDNSAAEACCQFYSGFCSSTNEVVFDNIVVSSTTTWLPGGTINGTTIPANGQFRVTGNITIQPGATLTMEDLYIEFSPTSKVVVSRGANATSTGARLNVRNTTLTAAQICGNCYMWLGIEAHGYSSSPQSVAGQSRVHISDNSVVEYAHNGVFFGNLDAWNIVNAGGLNLSQLLQQLLIAIEHTGGRILAQNSTFLNNKHDVTFLPYNNHINSSSFFNCDFITNENLPDGASNGFSSPIHIVMWNNRRIQIGTCRFSNTTPNLNDGSFRGIGISATGSNFNVFTYNGTPQSEFNDLNIGILAQNGNSLNFSVHATKFTNNYTGIFARNETNSNIRNNEFYVFNSGPNSSMETYGVYLEGCNRYKVEENYLTTGLSSEKNGFVYGIVADNSGPFSNVIEKNIFEKLNSGGISRKLNANLTTKRTGLQWLCNEFTNDDLHDLWVQEGGSIALTQGLLFTFQIFNNVIEIDFPTGNLFHSENSPQWHIRLEDDVPNILYHHHAAGTPTLYTSNKVALMQSTAQFANSIENYCGRKVDIPSFDPGDLLAQRNSLYDEKKMINDLLDFGDTDSLIMEIFGESLSAEQKRDLLKQQNITISDEVLVEYIVSNPPHQNLYQVLVYNSPLTDKAIYYMMEESNLPSGMKQQILLIQSGLSEFEANRQMAQEYELNIKHLENILLEKYLSDTTNTFGISQVVELYETVPEKDFEYLEMLFHAYVANNDAVKADSVNNMLKSIVNDPNYAVISDLAVSSISTDYFSLLMTDSVLIEQLEIMAEMADYRYSHAAQSLLSGYLGYFFEPGSGVMSGTKNMVYPKYEYSGMPESEISLFPNPAQDHFFIVFDENADVSQNREVKVYDL